MKTHGPIEFLMHARGDFPDGRIGPVSWPHFDLLWIHDGAIQVQFMQGASIEVRQGGGVLIYPETHFSGSAESGTRASVQHFAIHPNSASALPDLLARRHKNRLGYECLHALQPEQTARDIERAIELAQQPQTPTVLDMRLAMLVLILGQLTRGSDCAATVDLSQQRAFETLDAWMDEHLSQGLTVADIAAHVGLSESHCRVVFAGHFGMPPGRYLQRKRLIAAATQLVVTDTPIKRIAHDVGYTEVANFYHAFRRHFGEAPAAYRQRNQVRG